MCFTAVYLPEDVVRSLIPVMMWLKLVRDNAYEGVHGN